MYRRTTVLLLPLLLIFVLVWPSFKRWKGGSRPHFYNQHPVADGERTANQPQSPHDEAFELVKDPGLPPRPDGDDMADDGERPFRPLDDLNLPPSSSTSSSSSSTPSKHLQTTTSTSLKIPIVEAPLTVKLSSDDTQTTTTASTVSTPLTTPSRTHAFKDDDELAHVLPSIPTGTLRPQQIDETGDLTPPHPGSYGTHPIDELLRQGKDRYRALKRKRTDTLTAAGHAYRERRGRHPPPGFDKWWQFAKAKGSIIIEDFFDQIYHDIEPFWAIDPASIRKTSQDWHQLVTIRGGKATKHTNVTATTAWIDDWHHMISQLDGYLPDVDIALNDLDESRILVPWERINSYMAKAATTRSTDAPSSGNPPVQEYQSLSPVPPNQYHHTKSHAWEDWHNRTHWDFARMTCHPASEAYSAPLDEEITSPPFGTVANQHYTPQNSFHGYVSNWTKAKSACENPALRNIHGAFINPRWTSVNTTLYPLFSGSKIQGMNNDIIIPPAKYWSSEVEFSGDSDGGLGRWGEKYSVAMWRGSASGGIHDKTNWRRFPRQRLLSMMNGTQVTSTQEKLANLSASSSSEYYNFTKASPALPHNYPIPDPSVYQLAALRAPDPPKALGTWIDKHNDGGFVHFMCFPQYMSQFTNGTNCKYLEPFYTIQEEISLNDQFLYKYLPDIDGNSYSGRYRAFLRSGSLPIKSTIFTEWHDARLVEWVHFVPMDNSFVDYWGILEYFAGYDELNVNDKRDAQIDTPGVGIPAAIAAGNGAVPGSAFSDAVGLGAVGPGAADAGMDTTVPAPLGNAGPVQDHADAINNPQGAGRPDAAGNPVPHHRPASHDMDPADLEGGPSHPRPFDTLAGPSANIGTGAAANADDGGSGQNTRPSLINDPFEPIGPMGKSIVPDHDAQAREIAEEGRNWANKVLRHEDMLIYTYRLILEFARVSQDQRERMAWVENANNKRDEEGPA